MLHKDISISETESVKDAFQKLNTTAQKVLFVTDDKRRLLGTLSDGDLRRYVLTKGISLESDIKEIYNRQPSYLKSNHFSMERAKDIFIQDKIELIPILDEENQIEDCISWTQAFAEGGIPELSPKKLEVPVVIMAGGKGTRLEPFTKILPKPLIPIGDRPIVELIIDEFYKQGVKKYYLTLNHKAEMVESYFNSLERDYEIHYVRENIFLGTAGGLKLLEPKISDTFFVCNCDGIVKTQFAEILDFHRQEKASLTVLTSIQHHKIPYGVVKSDEHGKVKTILEKPDYTMSINTGVYLLNKEVLSYIPQDKSFHMTDLLRELVKNKIKVVAYPISGESYIDVGQWEEYKKAVDNFYKLVEL